VVGGAVVGACVVGGAVVGGSVVAGCVVGDSLVGLSDVAGPVVVGSPAAGWVAVCSAAGSVADVSAAGDPSPGDCDVGVWGGDDWEAAASAPDCWSVGVDESVGSAGESAVEVTGCPVVGTPASVGTATTSRGTGFCSSAASVGANAAASPSSVDWRGSCGGEPWPARSRVATSWPGGASASSGERPGVVNIMTAKAVAATAMIVMRNGVRDGHRRDRAAKRKYIQVLSEQARACCRRPP
jgi:hypothetical protein